MKSFYQSITGYSLGIALLIWNLAGSNAYDPDPGNGGTLMISFAKMNEEFNRFDDAGLKQGFWIEHDTIHTAVVESRYDMTISAQVVESIPVEVDTISRGWILDLPVYGRYVDDKREGPWVSFDNHGKVKALLYYRSGELSGYNLAFSSNAENPTLAFFSDAVDQDSYLMVRDSNGVEEKRILDERIIQAYFD